MSQGYVPGPAQVFVGTGASAAYEWLGYSQDGVDVQLIASYRDVFSDFGGPDVPVDSQFMGESGFISMTLNKYNETVLQELAGRRVGTGITPGQIEAQGLGSLMIAEGYAYPICIKCPYNTKSFQTGLIVPGYAFSAGWLHDNFEVRLSVIMKAPRLIFRVLPVWNGVNLTASLYTNTLPTLPSID